MGGERVMSSNLRGTRTITNLTTHEISAVSGGQHNNSTIKTGIIGGNGRYNNGTYDVAFGDSVWDYVYIGGIIAVGVSYFCLTGCVITGGYICAAAGWCPYHEVHYVHIVE